MKLHRYPTEFSLLAPGEYFCLSRSKINALDWKHLPQKCSQEQNPSFLLVKMANKSKNGSFSGFPKLQLERTLLGYPRFLSGLDRRFNRREHIAKIIHLTFTKLLKQSAINECGLCFFFFFKCCHVYSNMPYISTAEK